MDTTIATQYNTRSTRGHNGAIKYDDSREFEMPVLAFGDDSEYRRLLAKLNTGAPDLLAHRTIPLTVEEREDKHADRIWRHNHKWTAMPSLRNEDT